MEIEFELCYHDAHQPISGPCYSATILIDGKSWGFIWSNGIPGDEEFAAYLDDNPHAKCYLDLDGIGHEDFAEYIKAFSKEFHQVQEFIAANYGEKFTVIDWCHKEAKWHIVEMNKLLREQVVTENLGQTIREARAA